MDGFGHQVFPGAALALNEHGGSFAHRHLAHEAHQLDHARGFPHHLVITGALAHLIAQAVALGTQARAVDGVGQGDLQLIKIQRLLDEVQGPQFDGRLDVVKLRITGNHDDGNGKVVLLDFAQDFNAAQIRQPHIEQDEVGSFRANLREPARTAFGLDGDVTPLFQLAAHRPADQLFIVDNQNFFVGHKQSSGLGAEPIMNYEL